MSRLLSDNTIVARRVEGAVFDLDDTPEADTVQGLGKRKNALFLDRLQKDGVEVCDDTITLIRALREAGVAGAHLEGILPGADLRPALFLDYDGTLTPIVERPADAELSDTMHARLEGLAGLCPVAVVSGRDLADVRRRVGIDGLWYAGSHGFDIAGPGGERDTYQQGTDDLPALDAAEAELRDTLGETDGCEVERKRFSIAIHYRRVAEAEVGDVIKAVEEARNAHRGLRLSRGKQVLELQPDVPWDKGRALRWLMEVLDAGDSRLLPIYLGDDVTDEDAFRELADPELDGVGIVVSAASERTTHAAYRLDDPPAVAEFLDRLAEHLEARP